MLAYTDIFCNINQHLEYARVHNVQLVLASKTIDKDTLQRVNQDFPAVPLGENRVQELCDKYFDGALWFFIGRLQRNKVKYLVDKVEMICSVDSLPLAQEIQKQCAKKGKTMPVLVEINLGEAQKGGVEPCLLDQLLQAIGTMPNLVLQGLMAVLPREDARVAAQKAHDIWLQYKEKYQLQILSMGMSEDYELAVEYGSTSIRLGSAVFGKRS